MFLLFVPTRNDWRCVLSKLKINRHGRKAHTERKNRIFHRRYIRRLQQRRMGVEEKGGMVKRFVSEASDLVSCLTEKEKRVYESVLFLFPIIICVYPLLHCRHCVSVY